MITWSARRRISYFLIVVVVILSVFAILAYRYRPIPTCFDGIQNQGELGVDCGGPCEAVCEVEIREPRIVWSLVLEMDRGMYDVVTRIDNPNPAHAIAKLEYLTRVVDADNVLIRARRGVAFLNPGETLLIHDSRLDVGQRVPVRSFFTIEEPPVWQRVSQVAPKLSTGRVVFNNLPTPILTAVIRNESLVDLSDVQVVALLSNLEGNTIGVSSTVIERLGRGESKEVAFTWPRPFATEPLTIDLKPHFDLRQVTQP